MGNSVSSFTAIYPKLTYLYVDDGELNVKKLV